MESRKQAARPAQAPVAERGLGLAVLHLGERGSALGEKRLDLVNEAQVDEVGAQQPPHQELGGEVVELPVARGGLHLELEATRRPQERAEDVLLAGGLERGPHVGEGVAQPSLEVHLSVLLVLLGGDLTKGLSLCQGQAVVELHLAGARARRARRSQSRQGAPEPVLPQGRGRVDARLAAKARRSCICTTARSAALAQMARIMPQPSPSAGSRWRYSRARAASSAGAVSSHPSAVSLSCVPT